MNVLLMLLRGAAFAGAPAVKRDELDYVIDLDSAPFVPKGWTVASHKTGSGEFRWDPSEFRLFDPGYNRWGFQLCEEVRGQNLWNANLLDWLLANPDCIPNECRGKKTLFMGTLYTKKGGGFTTARYLYKSFFGFGKWKSGIGLGSTQRSRGRPERPKPVALIFSAH